MYILIVFPLTLYGALIHVPTTKFWGLFPGLAMRQAEGVEDSVQNGWSFLGPSHLHYSHSLAFLELIEGGWSSWRKWRYQEVLMGLGEKGWDPGKQRRSKESHIQNAQGPLPRLNKLILHPWAPAPHTGASSGLSCSTPKPALCLWSRKASEDGPSPWDPGFGWAWIQPLQPFESEPEDGRFFCVSSLCKVAFPTKTSFKKKEEMDGNLRIKEKHKRETGCTKGEDQMTWQWPRNFRTRTVCTLGFESLSDAMA